MRIDTSLSWWLAERGSPLADLTVGAVLDRAADRAPDRLAVVLSAYSDLGLNVRWTYHDLLVRANGLAEELRRAGIGRGDRVAIWSPNVPQWVQAEFAVAKTGATVVTINPTFKATEAAFVLEDSAAVGCLFLPQFGSFDIWSQLRNIMPRLDTLRFAWSLGEQVSDLPAVDEFPPCEQFDSGHAVAPSDIAQIQYTSGTTGRPKGAMLSHRSLVNNALLTMDRWRVGPGDVWCNPMPFFHTTGCGMMTLGIAGVGATHCPIVWFDADRVLDTIERERCTLVETVPTTLLALLDRQRARPRDLKALRVVGTSGAPVPRVLAERVPTELGAELRVLYGLTEASPTISCTMPEDPSETVAVTVGRPLPWTDVRIVDQAGTVVPTGVPGELQARGYLVMAGYLNQPEATSAAVDGEGWLRSGDIATMSEDGYISIAARVKDVVIRGGENIYPAEVEDLLRDCEDVVDACVVGVPDPFFGEEACAFVILCDGAVLDETALRAKLRASVSHQKVPRYLLATDSFPKTASGKIRRFMLQQVALSELGL